jgi:hypothetical protein
MNPVKTYWLFLSVLVNNWMKKLHENIVSNFGNLHLYLDRL